ncbi:MAG TPA: PhoU domain-containing protein [Acidimicrobiales bacterium]|nr:PhoU domain-containing protein [Acidimicrobiales bacterium]
MAELRRAYHDRIADLKERSGVLIERTADAVDRLTTALLERDADALSRVAADAAALADEPKRVEDDVLDTVAREAPVARDLRVVLASLFISQETALCLGLVRMLASRAGPADEVLTPVLRGLAYEIGEETVELLHLDAAAWAVLDEDRALAVIDGAQRSRSLQRRFLTELLDLDDVRVEAAVDLGMMARAYERLIDHAVEIAGRVVFAATGAPPAAAALTGDQA